MLYGLGAIKGVGEAALEGIIEEREAKGPYVDLYDFCHRCDGRKVNRRTLEALIKSGALDSLGMNRASLMASLNSVLQLAEQNQKNAKAGQNDMFGSSVEADSTVNVHEVKVSDWDDDTRLFNEKETLGLYLTGHPITRYEKEIRQFTECALNNVESLVPSETGGNRYAKKNQREVRLAGLMISLRARKTQRGSKIVTAVLDDRTARIEMVLYEEVHEKYAHLLQKD